MIGLTIVRIRKEHYCGRKFLKLHCKLKQFTTWSDAALFAYELPLNSSSAYNLCGQSRLRAGPIGQNCLTL